MEKKGGKIEIIDYSYISWLWHVLQCRDVIKQGKRLGTKKIPEKDPNPIVVPLVTIPVHTTTIKMPLAQIMEGIEMFEDKGQKELIEMVQNLCRQLKGRQGGGADS